MHFEYTSVDEAVKLILQLGQATQLAKLDIESAYRIVPVHPAGRLLLGMEWREKLYIDTALPFGLRSAHKIFNAIADALQWILESHRVRAIHYLDDFLLFGPPDSDDCKRSREVVEARCAELGVPITGHKTEGPTCQITFLGIELDSRSMMLRLPQVKLRCLQDKFGRWTERSSCT